MSCSSCNKEWGIQDPGTNRFWKQDIKFCPECGTNLADPNEPSETYRKYLTGKIEGLINELFEEEFNPRDELSINPENLTRGLQSFFAGKGMAFQAFLECLSSIKGIPIQEANPEEVFRLQKKTYEKLGLQNTMSGQFVEFVARQRGISD